MHPYAAAVAAHLTRVDPGTRRAVLDDLDALLADGVDPADLGDPAEYAAAAAPEVDAGGRPGWGWGPWTDHVRASAWDPADPRLLVPRTLGWGWRVNTGALAVRCGWLRPDDADADVAAAVPPRAVQGLRVVPCVLAGIGAAAALGAVRRGRPVVLDRRLDGGPKSLSDPRWTLAPAAAGVAVAAWGAAPADGLDRVGRPALAASGTALVVAVLLASGVRRAPWFALAAVAAPVAAELGVMMAGMRAGLRHVARRGR